MAKNKIQLATKSDLNNYLSINGGTVKGNINMGQHEITNLADPTSPKSAVSKQYFNNNINYFDIEYSNDSESSIALLSQTITYSNPVKYGLHFIAIANGSWNLPTDIERIYYRFSSEFTGYGNRYSDHISHSSYSSRLNLISNKVVLTIQHLISNNSLIEVGQKLGELYVLTS